MAAIKNCKTAEGYFSPYIDEALDQEEMQALQDHLRSCPDCLSRLAMAQQAVLLLQRLREEDIALPEDFQARLIQRVLSGELALDALDFSWQGLLTTIVQLLDLVFGLLAGPQASGQPA